MNGEDGQTQPETETNEDELREKLEAKREWEGYSWHKVTGGMLGDSVAQPPLAEYIPPKDGLSVPPDPDRWKARVGAVEIRTSPEGLYKVSGGRLTNIRDGLYLNPFLTPAGRWREPAFPTRSLLQIWPSQAPPCDSWISPAGGSSACWRATWN